MATLDTIQFNNYDIERSHKLTLSYNVKYGDKYQSGFCYKESGGYKLGDNISKNGTHKAIKVGDTVFDNLNPQGTDFKGWMNDLFSPSGHSITGTNF